MKITIKVTHLFLSVLLFCSAISAQSNAVGKISSWTLREVYSYEKDDEILPVTYEMRVAKNKNFDRIVFEFAGEEVPEYSVGYVDAPITIDPAHIADPEHPQPDEIVKMKGSAFVLINFSLGFEGIPLGEKFSAEQNLPVIQDVKGLDWFENCYTFAVGLKSKKLFRVSELSNPTRLVIDFKNSEK